MCQRLIDVVHGAEPWSGADACAAAFADIRARSREAATVGWAARTAHAWEYYFATQAHAAVNRLRGTPADVGRHFQVRRGTAGTD